MLSICEQWKVFEKFCNERYGENGCQTSKTISREKGQKIIRLLQNDPAAEAYSSKFKFWVKQRGFSLINYSPLGLKDVLCLWSKKQVSYWYKCTYLQHIENCTVVCMFLLKGRMQHNNLSLPAEPKWSNHPCQLEKSCLCGWVLWHHQGDPLQRERTCWEQENSWRGI